MYKTRKKYITVEQLSREEVFAYLDSIDSDNKGEFNKLINESNAAFLGNKLLVSGPYNSTLDIHCQYQTLQYMYQIPDADNQSSGKEKTGIKKQGLEIEKTK